jgi:serine/threonine-protein kinase
MVTMDLGACEWFVWDLRRSNLVDRAQLDQMVQDFLQNHPGAEPPSLAEFLVDKGVLTQFQCERLLQGKTQGFVLGPFTLMDALGTGSMGTVYKAQSKNDGGWYAVKVLPRRSMWNVRIARRKVRAFDHIKHAAVVPFVDVGTAGGMHYLAWPFIEGETLDKYLQRVGRLDAETVRRIGMQVAEGLAACHPNGLIHGLLKPSNLLLTTEGDVRILDFGIGCLLSESESESLVDTMSTANSVSSGLDCASPESIMDPTNLTPAGDQYSLGCVLYFCLSGQYPFPDGSAVEKMMAHQTKKPKAIAELVPDAPPRLVAVIERLMQKDPEARFPHANAVAEALSEPFPVNTSSRPASVEPSRPAVPVVAEDARRKSSSLRSNPFAAGGEPAKHRPAPAAPRETPRGLPRVTPTTPSPRSSGPQPLPAHAAAAALPTRQSVLGQAPAAPAAPKNKGSRQVPAMTKRTAPVQQAAQRGFGSFGMTMLALLVGVLVWLLGRVLF